MSQPPGPPDQQPRREGQADPGVFGAPFEPQPGVYGQPPVAPYGQPPAAPAAPHGQPPAAPHGQPPTASYGRPAPNPPYGHGYPQPQPQPQPRPTAGGPGPGPGSGRRPRGRTASVVAAVLAGVLVIGAGVWYAVGGSGDDAKGSVATESTGPGAAPKQPAASPGRTMTPAPEPADLNAARKDGENKVLWVQENTVELPGRGGTQFGPWFAGDTVAMLAFGD